MYTCTCTLGMGGKLQDPEAPFDHSQPLPFPPPKGTTILMFDIVD